MCICACMCPCVQKLEYKHLVCALQWFFDTQTHLRLTYSVIRAHTLAQLRPLMDWLHSCRDRRAMDGELRRWREERDRVGSGCMLVCAWGCAGWEKRAECSGLGAREDLTWGQADHFLLGSTCHFLWTSSPSVDRTEADGLPCQSVSLFSSASLGPPCLLYEPVRRRVHDLCTVWQSKFAIDIATSLKSAVHSFSAR